MRSEPGPDDGPPLRPGGPVTGEAPPPGAGPLPDERPTASVPDAADPPPRKALLAVVAASAAAAGVVLAAVAVHAGFGDGNGGAHTPGGRGGVRGAGFGARPVTPGWQVVLAPRYGIAYDVPPGWTVASPDRSFPVRDSAGPLAAGGVADLRTGGCVRARTGLRGGAEPLLNPALERMPALGRAAQKQARRWASALYGGTGAPPRIAPGAKGTVTVHGVTAARASVQVTTARKNGCTPPGAVVEAVAMMATERTSAGPLVLVVAADRDVPGRLTDQDLAKLVASIRSYDCPRGTVLRRNTCALTTASPAG